MILIGYKQCSTCNKIEKLLQSKHLDYTYREIDKKNPTPEEIKRWHETSGLDIKKFFNTSGRLYKDLKLAGQLESMANQAKYDLLGKDGMLVKRPILLDGGAVYVGSAVEKYVSSR